MPRDDFQLMDEEAGAAVASVLVPEIATHVRARKNGQAAYREELIHDYHGATSLMARLRSTGDTGTEALVALIIEEMLGEGDNLLGNQLIATENGELRDASVISVKRADVLEKVMKAIQSKQQLEKEGGIDVESPSMMIIFRFFISKVKDVFKRMDTPDEQSDLFFQALGEVTENWKKELRAEFEAMKGR